MAYSLILKSHLVQTAALSVVVALTGACNFTNDSATKGANKAEQVAEESNWEALFPELLIYYANETSLSDEADKNFELFLNRIKNSDHEAVVKFREKYVTDRVEFKRTVASEIQDLKNSFCNPGNFKTFGLIIFTNESVRNGKITYCKEGIEKQLEFRGIKVPDAVANDFNYKSYPLSVIENLGAALATAADIFSPSLYRYVLISKSHGTKELAVAPGFIRKITDQETSEKLINAIVSYKQAKQAAHQPDKGALGAENKLGPDGALGADGALGVGVDNNRLGADGLLGADYAMSSDGFVNVNNRKAGGYHLGIRKGDFLRLLREFGVIRGGVLFTLVAFESCDSELDLSAMFEANEHPEKNVSWILTSDQKGLDYNTFDYKLILKNTENLMASEGGFALSSAVLDYYNSVYEREHKPKSK